MLGDEEIKESSLIRPGDEIISIHEVCLTDKFYKKDMGFCNEPLFSSSSANELEVPRFLRDGFYPDGQEQQARFAWTEEDGNIASLVSDPGFGTSAQTEFGKELDVGIKTELKEADTSSSSFPASNRYAFEFLKKTQGETSVVSSTNGIGKCNQGAYKIDKTDPRSRYHYVIYVKRHGRTVKLWECGICGREFQHQYTLMRHLPTHTDERNFHCSACGKSFRQLSTLSQHRAIHSAERPYSCEVCNKTFNRVSTLISHRKTHSEEKPYKCPICPKGFHQKGNLRNHLFTHTNERPYRCNICLKGFNQQSNLVCHKNKAHPDENCNTSNRNVRNITPTKTHAITESKADSSRSNDHCEVTSTVGPLSSNNTKDVSPQYFTDPINALYPWSTTGTGVVVDAIRTYHMGVALATRQTPFALLKPDKGNPVLVKVVDTKLPGGKQMLVPATAEDLRDGGKIIMKNADCSESQDVVSVGKGEDALQIRVPVVATVVPRIQPSGRLRLCVEEPHRAYQSLSTEAGEINLDPCTNHRQSDVTKPLSSKVIDKIDDHVGSAPCINSSCSLPPPAPSPPLDLIPLDLFEPMECLPMGPQITAVNNVDQPPGSDDSDIFIGTFEESIPLSDSD